MTLNEEDPPVTVFCYTVGEQFTWNINTCTSMFNQPVTINPTFVHASICVSTLVKLNM